MYPVIKKSWRGLLIALLFLALIVVGNMFSTMSVAHDKLLEDIKWSKQALEDSTARLVEARIALMPRQFENYEAMEEWVEEWLVENGEIIKQYQLYGYWLQKMGYEIADEGELYSEYWDCDDPSEAMARDARIDGYIVSECLVGAEGMVYDTKVGDVEFHAGCMAMTDNAYWYIEPQTGEITKLTDRD